MVLDTKKDEKDVDVPYILDHGKQLEAETDVDLSDKLPERVRRQSLAEHLSQPSTSSKYYDNSTNQMLVQLDELQVRSDDVNLKWQERVRWIKYEEDYEKGANRWGKPHVAILSFLSFLELRDALEEGVILLDVEEVGQESIYKTIVDECVNTGQLPMEKKEKLLDLLMMKHKHVHAFGLANPFRRRSSTLPPHQARGHRAGSLTAGDIIKQNQDRLKELNSEYVQNNNSDSESKTEVQVISSGGGFENTGYTSDPDDAVIARSNSQRRKSAISINQLVHHNDVLRFMSEGAEACNIMVGKADFIEKALYIFVRLDEPQGLRSINEGFLPTRFLFIALGPHGDGNDYYEIGRCFGAVMATLDFQQVAWDCMGRKSLVNGINKFLDDSLVLPAGYWDEDILNPIIETARKKAVEVRRKSLHPLAIMEGQAELLKNLNLKSDPCVDPLSRTGKPFGGMVNDIKRRYPLYLSDIKDGINPQCLATFVFIFFACLAPAITFGGLLTEKVERWMGVSELLLATAIFGIANALFACQPIMIIGLTGPTLLFEESYYQICKTMDVEYISSHVWVGVWIFIISVIVVACDASVLIKLISRFTEEIFSALISLLFIYETFYKLYLVFKNHPLTSIESYDVNNENRSAFILVNGTLIPTNLYPGDIPQPNTALLSLILTFGTFGIAMYLRGFRNTKYLGRTARRALGDFGIPIAILVMVLIDFSIDDTYTQKLFVPDGLKPTSEEWRSWYINPLGMQKPLPIWMIFAASIPALLAFILIFMETQITAVIVNKPDRNMKKGSGFHFDILLVGIYCLVSGFMGLPLMGAAAVRSITHVNSLSVYSRTHAPGEKPHLVHVHEQRITALLVHIVMGFTSLIGPVLKTVPLAVLFGVFLYMGVASMSGVQLFDRIEMLFMPIKHHPNEPFVRHVRTWKMHLFTFIQLICLAILWAVKSTQAALAFPFVLILMVPIRRYLLPRIFTKHELKYLDLSGPVHDDDDSETSSQLDDETDEEKRRQQLTESELFPDLRDQDFYEESKMSNLRKRKVKSKKKSTNSKKDKDEMV